ncbi:MAG: hypothetical protein FJX73_00705 [Armatimonadetes bacterium]|nr:hypothetical protein [Armatimonadota bacterium]
MLTGSLQVGPPVPAAAGAGGVLDGTLLFARFAFMPNHLGYCGDDSNATLLAYMRESVSDQGLRRHLNAFSGALPYLRVIAESNGIADPFDARVVEAYWIGNGLLETVDWAFHARRLHERFSGRVRPATMELLVGKPRAGARAHHAFHVFDVSFRTGLPQGDAALDLCRIGWGTVNAVEPVAFTVTYRPIVLRQGRLCFGEPQTERVLRAMGTDQFLDEASVGDVIAFHWRWACLKLTPAQVANLERYTQGMLALANQTF